MTFPSGELGSTDSAAGASVVPASADGSIAVDIDARVNQQWLQQLGIYESAGFWDVEGLIGDETGWRI